MRTIAKMGIGPCQWKEGGIPRVGPPYIDSMVGVYG